MNRDESLQFLADGLRTRLSVMIASMGVEATVRKDPIHAFDQIAVSIQKGSQEQWVEQLAGLGTVVFKTYRVNLFPTDKQLQDIEELNLTIQHTAQRILERWVEERLERALDQVRTPADVFYITDEYGIRTRDGQDEEFLCTTRAEALGVISFYFDMGYGKAYHLVNKTTGSEEVIRDDSDDET